MPDRSTESLESFFCRVVFRLLGESKERRLFRRLFNMKRVSVRAGGWRDLCEGPVVFPVLYKGVGDQASLQRKADTETPAWGFTRVNRGAKTSERGRGSSLKLWQPGASYSAEPEEFTAAGKINAHVFLVEIKLEQRYVTTGFTETRFILCCFESQKNVSQHTVRDFCGIG